MNTPPGYNRHKQDMKTILDCRVRSAEWVNARNVLIKLTADEPLPHLYPGQFVEVRVDAPNVFLRRPISVHLFDSATNELSLIVQVVGKGTKALSAVREGDFLNLVLPLGNRFSIPDEPTRKLLLVGGGVGVAPLLFLGAELKRSGHTPVFLLGARTETDLLRKAAFSEYGEVYCTTEDGSTGERGFVTQHSLLVQTSFDFIYTCGLTDDACSSPICP